MDPIKAVISTPAEGEEQFVATLKSAGADENRIAAAVAAFRIQKGFADVLKSEDVEAVLKAGGFKFPPKKKDDEDMTDEEKAAAKKKATKKSGELDLAGLAPEAQAQVQAIFKSHEALEAKTGRLEEVVKSLTEATLTREYVAKAAKEYSHIPGTAAELGLVLKSAHESSPELAKGLEKILSAVNGLVQKSALLSPSGVAGGAAPAGSAMQRIETLAHGLTLKADNGKEMSKEQKVTYVCTKTAEGAALYREYLAENPAQRAQYNF